MYLTMDEERIYDGESGETLAKCMEILVTLGEIYGADRLIPVRSVQVAGVSYRTIGDAGLEWIRDLEGEARVPAILNPAGMDLEEWKKMGIDEEFAERQLEIIRAYERLGVRPECTCTPYHVHNDIARFRDHLAWSESSAVSFANSVIGARTNREGAPAALAAALIGKTPNYGLHLDEEREPTLTIKVEGRLEDSDFGALGVIAGPLVKSEVPIFEFEVRPTPEELKQLGAAMAATGSVALYHVKRLTPESELYREPRETITIEWSEIREVYNHHCEPDLIAIGCPHTGPKELARLAELLKEKQVKKELWIFTSRKLAREHKEEVKEIRRSGAKLFCDTCMVVSPASERFKCMMVNSGKALNYVPKICGVECTLRRTEECIERALTGEKR